MSKIAPQAAPHDMSPMGFCKACGTALYRCEEPSKRFGHLIQSPLEADGRYHHVQMCLVAQLRAVKAERDELKAKLGGGDD